MNKTQIQHKRAAEIFLEKHSLSPVTAEIDGSNPFGVAMILGGNMLEEILKVKIKENIPTEIVLDIISKSKSIEDFEEMINDFITMKLITMEDASKKFDIPYSTLGNWVSDGKLERHDFKKIGNKAGRSNVMLSFEEVESLAYNPPKMGRPTKLVS